MTLNLYPETMTENEISYKIIGVALEIHKNIGPGLLESAYESALVYDLQELGFEVKQQVSMLIFQQKRLAISKS